MFACDLAGIAPDLMLFFLNVIPADFCPYVLSCFAAIAWRQQFRRRETGCLLFNH